MSTQAIIKLKQEERDQSEKLKALSEEKKDIIQAGERAQREVGAQQIHVNELVEAIVALEKIEAKKRGTEVSEI